jgi:hypothetical protein
METKPPAPAEILARLTEINLEDIQSNLGWGKCRLGRGLVRALFLREAVKFARQMQGFDQAVEQEGLAAAAQAVLPEFVQSVRVLGQEHIPSRGPVLICSNHPGMTDTLALFSALPRADLRVLAAERPFLHCLQAVEKSILYISPESGAHFTTLRAAASHLRGGGAVLTFPAGKIEPDPQLLPGAGESLAGWSESIGMFARLVPGLQMIPAVVSGVLAPQAYAHPLTRLRRAAADRERLGATLQLLVGTRSPRTWPVTPTVRFGPALPAGAWTQQEKPGQVAGRITAAVRPLLAAASRAQATFPPP